MSRLETLHPTFGCKEVTGSLETEELGHVESHQWLRSEIRFHARISYWPSECVVDIREPRHSLKLVLSPTSTQESIQNITATRQVVFLISSKSALLEQLLQPGELS